MIEELAQEIYSAQSLTPQVYPFVECENLPEQAKENYIEQARYLSKHFHITPRGETDDGH